MKTDVRTRSQNCERDYLSIRLPAWNTSSPTVRISIIFDIWEFLKKYVETVEHLLQFEKNNAFFTWRPKYVYYNISIIFFEMRDISDK